MLEPLESGGAGFEVFVLECLPKKVKSVFRCWWAAWQIPEARFFTVQVEQNLIKSLNDKFLYSSILELCFTLFD